MAKKDFTFTSKVLMSLLMAGDMLFVNPREMRRRAMRGQIFGDFSRLQSTAYYLIRKGLIKYVDKNNERFIHLTKHGELEALLAKARLAKKPKEWDGKWRLVIFDIPEESRDKRNLLRGLLKKNYFKKLQASVFVSPYPLNREAIKYLKEAKLKDYIRILKIEEIDDDGDLIKEFKLKKVSLHK